mgnify:CR=1 FL=1
MALPTRIAMVLAMVPAALAANQAYSVEPDSTIKIKTSITGFTVTNWESSDESVATVAAVSGSKTEAIVTGKNASNTAIRITATGTLANGRSHSEYFTVYVRDAYTLTLALSNSNINGTVALNQNDTRTLTATVTVGSSAIWQTAKFISPAITMPSRLLLPARRSPQAQSATIRPIRLKRLSKQRRSAAQR